jgi:hypothetical protein
MCAHKPRFPPHINLLTACIHNLTHDNLYLYGFEIHCTICATILCLKLMSHLRQSLLSAFENTVTFGPRNCLPCYPQVDYYSGPLLSSSFALSRILRTAVARPLCISFEPRGKKLCNQTATVVSRVAAEQFQVEHEHECECLFLLSTFPDELSLLCTRLSAYSRW